MHKDFEFEGTYDIIVGRAWWKDQEDSWSPYIVNQEAKSEQKVKNGHKTPRFVSHGPFPPIRLLLLKA